MLTFVIVEPPNRARARFVGVSPIQEFLLLSYIKDFKQSLQQDGIIKRLVSLFFVFVQLVAQGVGNYYDRIGQALRFGSVFSEISFYDRWDFRKL